MKPAVRRAMGVSLGAAILSACAMHGDSTLIPALRGTGFAKPFGSKLTAGKIFVSDPLANVVQIYAATGQGQKPTATIRKGIHGPAGLTIDTAGNLYVANTLASTVTEYPPNAVTPSATYASGVLRPVDVGVDNNGTLYVANFGSFALAVVEFAAGSTTPSAVIAAPCGCYPIGLTLDRNANLYVAYDDFFSQTVVYEYAPGSTSGVSVNLNEGSVRWEAAGMDFDRSSNLLVANATLPGIQVFRAGNPNAKHVFGKRGSPRFLQIDAAARHVFVTDTKRHAVEEYAYPSGRLVDVITAGLRGAYGIALSP